MLQAEGVAFAAKIGYQDGHSPALHHGKFGDRPIIATFLGDGDDNLIQPEEMVVSLPLFRRTIR